MFINPELNLSDAFVASWLPGTETAGISDVLFTDTQGSAAHDMTGRLSFSWPVALSTLQIQKRPLPLPSLIVAMA